MDDIVGAVDDAGDILTETGGAGIVRAYWQA